jgi:hypothetical protein
VGGAGVLTACKERGAVGVAYLSAHTRSKWTARHGTLMPPAAHTPCYRSVVMATKSINKLSTGGAESSLTEWDLLCLQRQEQEAMWVS